MLTLLYRGRLSSCNYTCTYCPFATHRDSPCTLAQDEADLCRFVQWVAQQSRPLRVFFTPWGEALVRRYYQEAILTLAALPHVVQVAVQTNASASLRWLAQCATPKKIGLVCSYHPTQVSLARWLTQCAHLRALGVPYSVGMVAMREHFDDLRALQAALPPAHPIWLNAYDRRGPDYYSPSDVAWLSGIDPWFDYNLHPRPSYGQACLTGETVLTIDGEGELHRCHLIAKRLGNVYDDALDTLLHPRPCTRHRCDCYIAYAHRPDLPFMQAFGAGLLLRRSFYGEHMK